MIGRLRFETLPNDFLVCRSVRPSFPYSMSAKALNEGDRLSNHTLCGKPAHAALSGTTQVSYFSFLLTTIYSHVRCSIDIPPISHTCSLLLSGYTCFQCRSIGYPFRCGACAYAFASAGSCFPFPSFNHVALEKTGSIVDS